MEWPKAVAVCCAWEDDFVVDAVAGYPLRADSGIIRIVVGWVKVCVVLSVVGTSACSKAVCGLANREAETATRAEAR